MMQMLVAGGMVPLSDGERTADADNPRGYLEWERIKTVPNDPGCIAEAEGRVVKVISRLLLSLPAEHEYRVVFMQRPLPECGTRVSRRLHAEASAGSAGVAGPDAEAARNLQGKWESCGDGNCVREALEGSLCMA